MSLQHSPDHSQLSRFGRAALAYAERCSWQLFPLPPRSKDHPLVKWGSKATSDLDQLATWWTRWPAANPALTTGQRSGIVVVDIDPRHGGDRTWAELLDLNGTADTLEAVTGSGGRHIYFQAPTEALKSVNGGLGEGVDTKANGGYVVLPPSVHPNGNAYFWDTEGLSPAPVPPWLLALWPRVDARRTTPRGAAVLGAPIIDGERNSTLTSLAGALRRRGLGQTAIEAALLAENIERCQPPLPDADVLGIAQSIGRYPPGRYPSAPHRPSGRNTHRKIHIPPMVIGL